MIRKMNNERKSSWFDIILKCIFIYKQFLSYYMVIAGGQIIGPNFTGIFIQSLYLRLVLKW